MAIYNDIEIQDVGFQLKEKLNNLPRFPGVYQFKNAEGKIIYVGKAKILRNRVRSYFQKGHDHDPKTKVMVSKIADLEVIVTDTEMEALILENTLIKKIKPRYNIDLRDDKSYPYIIVTNEPFPRVYVTRKIKQDGSRYYGPYTDVKTMRYALKSVRDIFQIRSCRLPLTVENISNKKWKICLDYHIGKCGGPCEGLVSLQEYNGMISQVEKLLRGKTRDLVRQLTDEMSIHSERLEFEKAGLAKKKIDAIKVYSEKQKIVSLELIERDIIAAVSEGDDGCGVIFKVRDGKLIGKQHFYLSNVAERSESEMIQTLIERYYVNADYIPPEIYLSAEPVEVEFIEDIARSKRGSDVKIVVPADGEDLKLIKMCRANAKFMLDELKIQKEKGKETVPHTLQALQRDLHLPAPPRRIECFDNSNIQGSDPVASMVVFVDGKPRKSDYRKFKIRTVVGPDDFASMEEVIERRYTRVMNEGGQSPDLVVVDGGKGQLSSAVEILRQIGLENQPIIGLAKRLEEVFVPGESESILLPRTSSALKLLQHIRDEAHRFAITFHRSLREKRVISTQLTGIEGIGETRATKLLRQFGSVKGVQDASLEDIAKVVGMKAAESIQSYFRLKGEDVKK
ncbi:MAG TPA: excinuclease ABC subunit UvrC [Candidatus Acidoferrales bacterium]|nr:excinuclease ABC subunit UvrC [Candidatus Acidoferrales bacterium]